MNQPNGWNEWGRHVLAELERNEETHGKIMEKLDKVHDDLLMLKTKATVWGSVAGSVFGVIAGLLMKFYG